VRGLIVDCYESRAKDRPVVCLVGRLESGETFGVLDDAPTPRLYVRESDLVRTRAVSATLSGHGARAALAETSRRTMDGEPVWEVALSSGSFRAVRGLSDELIRQGVRTYEGDVDAARTYLRERGIKAEIEIEGASRTSPHLARVFEAPKVSPAAGGVAAPLTCLALDIETDPSLERVLAISLVRWGGGEPVEEVHVAGKGSAARAALSEESLLRLFVARVKALDPDLLTGWNVIDFDFAVLLERLAHYRIEARLGRSAEPSRLRESKGYWGGSRVEIRGRQALDALRLVRALPGRFDDLRLGTVSQALLGRGKTIAPEEWESMPDLIEAKYEADPEAFAEYCLEDSRLVRDILRQEHLVELSVARSKLVGLTMDRAWGSVAPFENLYALDLARRQVVAPTRGVDAGDGELAPGGLVMEPKAGLYANILVFDFKSLYPSIMRTFNVDPLAHAVARAKPAVSDIVAPNGAPFARERGLLPGSSTSSPRRARPPSGKATRSSPTSTRSSSTPFTGCSGPKAAASRRARSPARSRASGT
jgi:DNA polymerase-2